LCRGYARMLKTLLTDDGGIFSSRAMARTPNPLFLKSPTALEYAFNVAGRPNWHNGKAESALDIRRTGRHAPQIPPTRWSIDAD